MGTGTTNFDNFTDTPTTESDLIPSDIYMRYMMFRCYGIEEKTIVDQIAHFMNIYFTPVIAVIGIIGK